MEDKEKKSQQGMSDAARRRAEDAKKARELRKQALEELAQEDKRRAAELLGQETGNAPVKPQNTTEPEEKKPVINAADLLAKDPKEAIRVLLEEKGATKEDLDAYAAGQKVNSYLERILEAFGGRDAYKKNIMEFSLNDPSEAEQRLVNALSMMDVSEIAVLVKNHYKKEAAKIAEQKEEDKVKGQKNLLLRLPGPVVKLLQHGYVAVGIVLLSRPEPNRVWIGMAIAFIAYLLLAGTHSGIFGQKAKNPKGYSTILPAVFAVISLFCMEKVRVWLWYSWISGAFYRLLTMILMVAFAVVCGTIFAILAGLVQKDERK